MKPQKHHCIALLVLVDRTIPLILLIVSFVGASLGLTSGYVGFFIFGAIAILYISIAHTIYKAINILAASFDSEFAIIENSVTSNDFVSLRKAIDTIEQRIYTNG
jgi:hypothetical protein